MSVALNNGASVAAFIGLTGQAFWGILFIYELVEDIKDAPGHLRVLYHNLSLFQISLASFQETTTIATRLGTPILGVSTTQVLDDAADAIKPILSVFQKYGQGRATPFRKRIRVALRKKRLLDHAERLKNSSSLVNSTNSTLTMHNITFQNQHFNSRNETISSDFLREITEKFAALQNEAQATSSLVANTFMEIIAKFDGLPDSVGRRLEGHFSELPVIAETARNTFLVVQDCFKNTQHLSGDLSIQLRRVVRDTTQQAISQSTSSQVTVSDIEAIMYRVLIEHDLEIKPNISRHLGKDLAAIESASTVEPSCLGIRQRKSNLIKGDLNLGNEELPRRAERGNHISTKNKKPKMTLNSQQAPSQIKFLAGLLGTFFNRSPVPNKENPQVNMPGLYIHVVFYYGFFQMKILSLEVSHIHSDFEFFHALSRAYDKRTDRIFSWQKYLSISYVSMIRIVKLKRSCFPSSPGRFYCGITPFDPLKECKWQGERVPDEIKNSKHLPPVEQRLLLHGLRHPSEFDVTKKFFSRIPKHVYRYGSTLGSMEDGWGLQIDESWDPTKALTLVNLLLSFSLVIIGIVATLLGHDLKENLSTASLGMILIILALAGSESMLYED